MTYTAKLTPGGLYEVFKDGQRVSTGTAGALSMYGLSPTKLSTQPTTVVETPSTQTSYVPPPTFAPPPVSEAQYQSIRQMVSGGQLTPQGAVDELNKQIKSGQYSGSVDTSRLFPSDFSYVGADKATYKVGSNLQPIRTSAAISNTTITPQGITTNKTITLPSGMQVQVDSSGNIVSSATNSLPDVAHQNDALFANLIKNSTATADEKKIMQEYYSIVSKNDSDKALKLLQNFNFGLEFSDPIFKAKAAIVTDALKQGLSGNTTDLAFKEKQLTNTLNDLRANTEATKGYLDFTHTQELEKLARSYETDLNTVRDNAAMVGKTSSSVRSKAEQLLNEQNTGLVQSSNKQFTYQTGQQNRNLASAETNYPLELAQLQDEATRKRIAALRTAETDLGSYGLGNLGYSQTDMLGNIPSDIGRQKIKDALSFSNFVF